MVKGSCMRADHKNYYIRIGTFFLCVFMYFLLGESAALAQENKNDKGPKIYQEETLSQKQIDALSNYMTKKFRKYLVVYPDMHYWIMYSNNIFRWFNKSAEKNGLNINRKNNRLYYANGRVLGQSNFGKTVARFVLSLREKGYQVGFVGLDGANKVQGLATITVSIPNSPCEYDLESDRRIDNDRLEKVTSELKSEIRGFFNDKSFETNDISKRFKATELFKLYQNINKKLGISGMKYFKFFGFEHGHILETSEFARVLRYVDNDMQKEGYEFLYTGYGLADRILRVDYVHISSPKDWVHSSEVEEK